MRRDVLCALAFWVAACGGDDDSGDGLNQVDASVAVDAGGDASTFKVVNGCQESSYVDRTADTSPIMVTAAGSYNPRCVKIKVGQALTIGASAAHPLRKGVLSPSDPEDPGNPITNTTTTTTFTFSTAGTFGYYCEEHGTAGMKAAVLVVP